MMRHLLEVPERYDELVANPELATAAIAETLRMSPPSQMNGRVATEDVEVAGTVIPARSLVFLLIASANRDDSRFADADQFDLHRSDNEPSKAFAGGAHHFGFGSGRHFCAGALLAKTELEISTAMYVERFPKMRLATGFVACERGIKMRAPESVLVRVGSTLTA
jgi:pulcherriminic acid synthase